MKIEECADKLLDEVGCTAELDDLPEFMELLRALVYAESERAAALVKNYGWPAKYDDHRDCLVHDILATSPGKRTPT